MGLKSDVMGSDDIFVIENKTGCPRTIFQFLKLDKMPVFGHKLP
jgi:hypothetical protein